MAGVHLYDESKLPRAALLTATRVLSFETSTCCYEGSNSGILYKYKKNYIVLPVHIDQMCTKIPSKHIRKNVVNVQLNSSKWNDFERIFPCTQMTVH
jgi:hypothetical protein